MTDKIYLTCKTCNKKINKRIPYCSTKCINEDKEFHEICKTAYNVNDAARKCNIPPTSLRRILKELNIVIITKEKEKPVEIKTCPKCGKEHTSKYGIHCSRSCANGRIHSEETRNKIKNTVSKYYQEHPEAIEKLKEHNSGKNHTEETKKKLSESLKDYYKNNFVSEETKKKLSEATKEFYKDKKKPKEHRTALCRVYASTREAKKKNAITDTADIKLIQMIYKNTPEGYEVDHIIPISKGGLHHQNNLQYLPLAENRKKGSKLDYSPEGVLPWQNVIDLTENE